MADFNKKMLEQLAKAAHQVWMEGKIRDGWKYGPVTDKGKKIHSCLVAYEKLSELDKESDRDLVRGIPRILAIAGYEIAQKR
ncbi:MAG: RyR domain-containing protein [Candidatus Omnitrophica bacterium]|nr:RyR domain-containing protein [Candidatus Omnitrophota bacterium]